jgi:hypothetical protein
MGRMGGAYQALLGYYTDDNSRIKYIDQVKSSYWLGFLDASNVQYYCAVDTNGKLSKNLANVAKGSKKITGLSRCKQLPYSNTLVSRRFRFRQNGQNFLQKCMSKTAFLHFCI